MFKLSERSKKKLATCHKDIQIIMEKAIVDSPYDFGITHGHRTPEEQNELYQKGRTKPGSIVTYVDGYNKKSKHNNMPSDACDIVVYVNGKITWDEDYYRRVSRHVLAEAEKLYESGKVKSSMFWGGGWRNFKDYPHFEIVTPKEVKKKAMIPIVAKPVEVVKEKTKKVVEAYSQPTPSKWRKIGDAILGLGSLATSISAISGSPYITIGSAVLTYIGKTLTNFAK